KAAMNGVLNFSVLDGWWREAYNGENGWAIGEDADLDAEVQDQSDFVSLFKTLEDDIIPLYYERTPEDIPLKWIERVKENLRTITPQFSTTRMLKEYVENLYIPAMPPQNGKSTRKK
ncbi:MAG: alpha-glucan phosphorylase, partial [Anaerolineales bacterium]